MLDALPQTTIAQFRPGRSSRRLFLMASTTLVLVALSLFATAAVRAGESVVPELMRSALSYHPSLRSQQGRKDAAGAGVDAARWQFWPTPSVSVESAKGAQDDPSYRGDSSVSYLRVQQPLWTGGRLTGSLSRAEARAAVAEAELLETRQQLALRVVQAWSEALVAEHKLAAYESSRAMHQRLLGLVQRRFSEGASAQADVALASSRLDTLQAGLEAVAAQRDTARERLRLLTGSDLGSGLTEKARELPLPARERALSALLDAARAQSPLLAKTRAQAEAAEAEIEVARAALSPELYLRLERQYGSFLQAGMTPQDRAFVGLSTSFGGGLSSLSGIDSAIAQHRAALEDLQTQQLALDEQVQADHTLALAAQSRRLGLESALQAAADVRDSYERQFLAGRKQWLDLMNAVREQAQSDVQLADALGALQLANWRLALLSRGVDALIAEAGQDQDFKGKP